MPFIQKDFVERVKVLLEENDELVLHCSGAIATLYEQILMNRRVTINKQPYVIHTERKSNGIRLIMTRSKK